MSCYTRSKAYVLQVSSSSERFGCDKIFVVLNIDRRMKWNSLREFRHVSMSSKERTGLSAGHVAVLRDSIISLSITMHYKFSIF